MKLLLQFTGSNVEVKYFEECDKSADLIYNYKLVTMFGNT